MNKIVKVIVLILTIIEISFLYLAYKSYNVFSESVIEEIKVNSLNDVNNKNASFAVLIEGNNGVFTENNDRTKWPDSNLYYYYDTQCYDELGNLVDTDASFVFTTQTYTLTTKKSLFCYIRFGKLSSTSGAINTILKNAGGRMETIENQNARGDNLRRIQGSAELVKNNYICLGTSNKEECITTEGLGLFMYRIMGIVTAANSTTKEQVNQVKVIKKEALDTKYAWHSTTGTSYTWGLPSALNRGINGTYFLTNTSYKLDSTVGSTNKTWATNVIVEHNWQYADMPAKNDLYPDGETAVDVYKIEKESWSTGTNAGVTSSTSSNPSKIGLMYASDFYLAISNTVLNSGDSNNGDVLETNWIHLLNNDSKPPVNEEWTMTRRDIQSAFRTGSLRGILAACRNDSCFLNGSNSVRPVFYLSSTIQITGTGTITDPFIITNV